MDSPGEYTLGIMREAGWYNNWLFSFIEPHLGYETLEVGSGIGNFTELLLEKTDVVAIDLNRKYLSNLKKRYKERLRVGFGNIEKGEYYFEHNDYFVSKEKNNYRDSLEMDAVKPYVISYAFNPADSNPVEGGVRNVGFNVIVRDKNTGIEVLYEDREDKSAGEKFADADLIGCPWRLVVSEKTAGKIELKKRFGKDAKLVSIAELLDLLI